MRVLVVEDVEVVRFLMYELLTDLGHDVILSSDGHEALQILLDSNMQMEVIFMDIHMPVLDGISTTKIIREREEYKFVPIIVLTADVLNIAGNEDLTSLFNGYLLKPVSKDSLIDVLNRL
jgi:CheY-like chemotaxis protein